MSKFSSQMRPGGQVSVSADFIEMVVKVSERFGGDYKRARTWLITPSLKFGGSPPLKLYAQGRVKEVFDYLENNSLT